MTITRLHDANEKPDPETVALLRHALAMAEDGELRSVALVATMTGHKTYTNFVTQDLQEAIGLTSFLHHTLCARMRDGARPE